MKLFLDTANLEEIHEASSWGIIDGVTTNPSLVAKEKEVDFFGLLKSITNLVAGPVSGEVIGLEANQMIEEGEALAKIAPNMVIKIPMTIEGLKAVSVLSKKNIATNVTLIFSAPQALLAAKAGATYVSPFVGRLDDIGENGIQLVRDIAEIFNIHKISTQIIAASIRNGDHITKAALAGAHIATLPFPLLEELTKHALTDIGIEKFLADWEKRTSK